MSADFVDLYHLKGMQCIWQAYSDDMFSESLGPDFHHEDMVNMAGWSRFYFKGILPKDVVYMRCDICNPQTKQLLRSFYFKFTKSYQTSLSGMTYVKDPILEEKIVHDGVLQEMRPVKNKSGEIVRYDYGHVTFKKKKLFDIGSSQPSAGEARVNAITQFMQRYSEKPKMIFLVTPPHLMAYAKLILILLKQLVDLNFDQSYMTKSNQKPSKFLNFL